VSYSGVGVLALLGVDPSTLIIGGSVAALIIIVICVSLMRKPVPGYQPGEPVDGPDPQAANDVHEQDGPVERKRGGTPGFTLPLPSDTGMSPAQAMPANWQTAPAADPKSAEAARTVSTDTTLDTGRTASRGNSTSVGAGTHGAGTEQGASMSPLPTAPFSMPPAPVAPEALQGEPPPPGFAPAPFPAAPVTAERSVLVFRSGSRAGEAIPLEGFAGGQCAIGRSEVPENQIVIRDDLKVSRMQHAIVTCDSEGRCAVRDNNSANKVFVNDACIDSAPVPLNHGDRIRIGLTELEYLREPAT
jgi:hypothetical protein